MLNTVTINTVDTTREVVDLEKSVVSNAVHVQVVPLSVIVPLHRATAAQHPCARPQVILPHHSPILHLNGQEVGARRAHNEHEAVAGKRAE